MPHKPIPFFVCCLALLAAAPACKDQEKCIKTRNAASDAWKAVTEAAAKNKLAPTIGIDELPPERKPEHVTTWSSIEKQAEMISASFAYDKITWNTANPARAKANEGFTGYFAKEKFKSFEMLLKDANAQYDATAAACSE